MTTLTIKVPQKATDKLSALVKELGGEIVSISSVKSTKKEKLIDEITMGLKQVREIKAGKAKSYTMNDLLNDE